MQIEAGARFQPGDDSSSAGLLGFRAGRGFALKAAFPFRGNLQRTLMAALDGVSPAVGYLSVGFPY